VLRAIASDPARSLIVIDPRRTETAELADVHIQVRPGGDAHCLTALLAVLVQEDLVDHDFVRDHTRGFDAMAARLRAVPVGEYCRRAGVPEEQIRTVARRIATAASVSMLEDLGIQQAPHSTLSSYLEKLVYVLTGNFAKQGGMNIHTRLASLGGGGGGGAARVSPVGGHRIIAGLIPCNVIPDEILADHPDRFRAMIVESTNPAHSLADSKRMREALDALDTVVVIDIAMTETARHADYILPAPSQYEKWEATFFTLEFPHNDFQLRAPIFEPHPGTLIEPEIHSRLVQASGALTEDDLAPLRAAAADGWTAFGEAFLAASAQKPLLGKLAPVVLYETLGRTLPDGAQAAAVLWGAAQSCAMTFPASVRRAGFAGEGLELGNALFAAILRERSGLTFTVDEYEDTWRRVETSDGRIHLVVEPLLDELGGLAAEDPGSRDAQFPFVLSAGERRTSTANTIYRDPAWRKRDLGGALRMNPGDAERLGIADGGRARVTTKRGTLETVIEITDTLQAGHVSLPNGLGLSYPNEHGERLVHGIPPNELTSSEDRDWFAGTPHHKHVPARVESAG
jgi:anaerobic selenocysteine-containing dehydrogenase